ncbi:MAG: hypothetical protein ACREKN_09725 [Longimicrobiaceae bacterium]
MHATHKLPGVGPLLLIAALLAAGVAAGCEGSNLFRETITQPDPDDPDDPDDDGSPSETEDTVPPSEVKILQPPPGEVVAVGDPLNVSVSLQDDVGLDSVVVVGLAAGGTPYFEAGVKEYDPADAVRVDTAHLVLDPASAEADDAILLIATGYDAGGNSAADTIVISSALLRGTPIALENSLDRIVDITSDGDRVFLSNLSRNRLEVLDVASDTRTSFRVGSEPWGLAISPDSTTLYVANSGGTNISVVDLTESTLAEDESRRIFTPNIQLFEVPFARDSVDVGGTKRSAIIPSSVTVFDFSDRPQFVAATAAGQLFYSTKPTGTAPDGTIRRRRSDGEVEFFLDYATKDQTSSLLIVNALDAALVEGDPNRLYVMSREGDEYTGFVDDVEDDLAAAGSETYFDYFRNIDDVGLQDTTFVAVSGDHRSVAFGEGDVNPGRVILYQEEVDGSVTRAGDTRDLVNNTAERVIGLALNQDGTLGAARGDEAYFFDDQLRLQGVGLTGDPTGGISLHPDHADYPDTDESSRLSFVSGVDDNGSPYLDVIDTFTFFRRARVFLRQPVTGPILAVQPPAGVDALVRVYAVSGSAVLRLDLTGEDLQ